MASAPRPKPSPRYRQPAKPGAQLGVGKVPAQHRPAAPVGTELDAGFGYQGGPIIQSPDVYLSFWGSSWNNAASSQALVKVRDSAARIAANPPDQQ